MNRITTLYFSEHDADTDIYTKIKQVNNYAGAIPREGEVISVVDKRVFYKVKAVWWMICANDTLGPICNIILSSKKDAL